VHVDQRFAAEGATVNATRRSAGQAMPQPSSDTDTGPAHPARADAGTSDGAELAVDGGMAHV